MNAINCPECGHTHSAWALRCPGCRHWNFSWLVPATTVAIGLSLILWMAR